jgi:hypothetical protein
VPGWRSVEEITHWGFAQAPVVMANEAHNGLARCIRTREVGIRIIRAAHDAGVRHLAMEALPAPAAGAIEPVEVIPAHYGGYLAQPEMRALMAPGRGCRNCWTPWPTCWPRTAAPRGSSASTRRPRSATGRAPTR